MNIKPEHERRVRLAGGPFVKPETLRTIKHWSKVNNWTLGEVIDRFAEDFVSPEPEKEKAPGE